MTTRSRREPRELPTSLGAYDAARVMDTLTDYLIRLRDRGDRTERGPRERRARRRDGRARFAYGPAETDLNFGAGRKAIGAANSWLLGKERGWARAGRLHPSGFLKADADARLPAWTFAAVGRAWPHLKFWDRVAVLILCDGTLEGMDMDAKENVIAVIEEAVDLAVAKLFGNILVEFRKGRLDSGEADEKSLHPRRRREHRVRHPETGELVAKAERDAWAAANPQKAQALGAPGDVA